MAQLSLCDLHFDEEVVQRGSLPFPCWAQHLGLNYISQAALPTGFLLGLANGRSRQMSGCIPSTSTSVVSGSDSTGWPLPSGS